MPLPIVHRLYSPGNGLRHTQADEPDSFQVTRESFVYQSPTSTPDDVTRHGIDIAMHEVIKRDCLNFHLLLQKRSPPKRAPETGGARE